LNHEDIDDFSNVIMKKFVEKELKNGELIEVLTAFSGTSRPFSLLYPSKKHESFHIRVFIDFLMKELKP